MPQDGNRPVWTRRVFLGTVGASLLSRRTPSGQDPDLDAFIRATMESRHVPGVAAARVERGTVVWSQGYGFANLERRVPMTPDTVINVGSVTKTVTATAVMQLVEHGRLQLDADVNDVLPFSLRNPAFPGVPITPRQLLTHTSSIRDTADYESSYACGDPTVPLAEWVERYVRVAGAAAGSGVFAPVAPGQSRAYSNVGFGVLGVLIEAASGQSFADYTNRFIFAPLGMRSTAWYLADADVSRHATPYRYVAQGEAMVSVLADPSWIPADHAVPAFVPHCLYSFPTLPDGLMRTSVLDLARFLGAYQGNGTRGAVRILDPASVRQLWTANPLPEGSHGSPAVQGLAWYQLRSGDPTWQHSGGDPGIATFIAIGPTGTGVAVISNSSSQAPALIGQRLLQPGG